MNKRIISVLLFALLITTTASTAFATSVDPNQPASVTITDYASSDNNENTGSGTGTNNGSTIRQYIQEVQEENGERPMPTDIQVVNEGGVALIIKTYEVSSGYVPESLVEPEFEQNGYMYAKRDILKVQEKYTTDTKLASSMVTVRHENKDGVVARFQPLLDYNESGYSGQLELDVDAIITEAAGSESYTYPISETREYTGFARNDPYGIPKSVVKNGITLQLVNVEWKSMGAGSVDGLPVTSLFTAVATYSGSGVGTSVTGYLSTGIYKGEVTKKTLDSVIYAIVYEGTPIPLPPIPPNYWPFIILAAVVLALGAVIVFWIYRKNIKIYALNDGKYFLIKRARIGYDNPTVDLSNLEYAAPSNDFDIVIDRFAAKRLHGRDIKIVRAGMEPIEHHVESSGNEYEFKVTYIPVEPPMEEIDFNDFEERYTQEENSPEQEAAVGVGEV